MIIDFIKDAGESLWDKVTGEDKDRQKAQKIVEFIKGLGIDISGVSADVDNDTVTIKGVTKTQEDREKVILAAGNVKGISHVKDEIKVVPEKRVESADEKVEASGDQKEDANGEARFYSVVKGDTLSAIAKKYYGDANKYPKIFEANKPMLKDPNKIYPGQTLRIPH